jgi:hypothetical protein
MMQTTPGILWANVFKPNDLITGQDCGDPMLSKCANPTCSTSFRYLHEGRLYVIDPRGTPAGHKPRSSGKSGQIMEYAWLCSSCCLYLTIQIDDGFKTRVIRKVKTEKLEAKK